MTLAIQVIDNGDTNYNSKINGNFANIKTAVEGIQDVLAGAAGGASSTSAAYAALFGVTVSVIGVGSYACSTVSAALTVAAGFAWRPSLGQVVRQLTASVIDFTGQPAATYYIEVDGTGAPSRSASTSGESLYSVVWTGSAFGTITRLAQIVWGAADDIAAQVSAALAATYTTLDARLEAGETKAVAGDLARTWQTGRLSLSVAGSADVTLNAVQANNSVLNFTGALTGNISVIVPLGTNPREWIVTNNTSGAYTLTVKGATGTGISVAQGGFSNLYQDGTNVNSVSGSGAGFGDVTGPASSTTGHLPKFADTTGKVLSDGFAVDTDGTLAANSDTTIATQKATKTAIATAIANLIGTAPGVLDTLGEISDAINDDANLYTTLVAALALKADAANAALTGNPTAPTASPGDNDTSIATTAFVTAAVAAVAGGGTETTTTMGTLIHGATNKATPVDADELPIADSAASFVMKHVTWANIKATLWTAWGALIAAGTQKATPVDADMVAIADSASSNATKYATFANVRTALQGNGLTVTDSGFRGIPQNSQGGNYTTVAADAGKHLYHASGAGAGDTFTIDSNANVAYAVGTAITFVNMDSNAVSIAITSDTMNLAGAGTTGTRTLAQYGIATAVKVTSTVWLISGTNLT